MGGANTYDNFDGPTSVYIKRKRLSNLLDKFKKRAYEKKRADVERKISFYDNHAIEEVCQYVQERWGFRIMDMNSDEYRCMYNQIRTEVPGDINMYMYVRDKNGTHMDIEIETNSGYITGGVTGKGQALKEFNNIMRDIYIFYGVMQDDIIEKTNRYMTLVNVMMEQ